MLEGCHVKKLHAEYSQIGTRRFRKASECYLIICWSYESRRLTISQLWSQIAKFMGPTWGPPGSCRPQMGPMLAPWTLLSGIWMYFPQLFQPTGVLNIEFIALEWIIAVSMVTGYWYIFMYSYAAQ